MGDVRILEKILVVNDCKLEETVIKDLLEEMGYYVDITNENDIMRKIDEFLPDILISNLIMKETTGDKIIEKVKKIRAHIWCVLSSNSKLTLEEYKEFNVDAVIQTPINAAKLQLALKAKDEFKFCPYCGGKL